MKSWLMALAACAAFPLVLLSAYLVYEFGSTGYDNSTRELVQRADSTANAVSQELDIALGGIKALANSEAALTDDLPKLYDLAQQFVTSTPGIVSSSLIAPDKRMIFMTLRPYGAPGIPVSQWDPVKQVFETGKPVVSGPFPSAVRDRIVTSLNFPIFQNGKVAYCLRIIFPTQTFNELLAAQNLPKDWTVAIVDKQGLFLARSRSADLLVGKPASSSVVAALRSNAHGVFDSFNVEETSVRTTIVKVPSWDWSVVLGVPTEALQAPIKRALILLVSAWVAAILIGLALSLWLARYLVGHINAVARASAAMQRGEKMDLSGITIRELSEVAQRLEEAAKRERRTHIALRDVTTRNEEAKSQLDMARRDALTGLPRRELFFELVEGLRQSLAKQGGGELAVLFVDLDGFKAVNDLYGHEQGDKVLVKVAEILNALTRGADAAARIGGDEFVICISAASEQIEVIAKDVARRILARVEKIGFGIRCSIGIAITPHQCPNLSCALRRADEAMYEAKRAGKNQYVVFGAEPKPSGSFWGALQPAECHIQCQGKAD